MYLLTGDERHSSAPSPGSVLSSMLWLAQTIVFHQISYSIIK